MLDMRSQTFNWQRRWLRQDQAKPEEDSRASAHDHSVSFGEISSTPGLGLFGAPGMGKSHEIAQAFRDARAQGYSALLVKVRALRGPTDLIEQLRCGIAE